MTQEIRRKRNEDKNKLEERGGRGGRGRGRGGLSREERPTEPEKKRDNTFADLEKPEEKLALILAFISDFIQG